MKAVVMDVFLAVAAIATLMMMLAVWLLHV